MKTETESSLKILTKIIEEKDLDSESDESIRELLVTCFGWTPEFQKRSYWHLKPDVRTLSIDESTNKILGHISIVNKEGIAQNTKLHIAGAGGFAIHPDHQVKGIGTQLAQKMLAYVRIKKYDLVVVFAKDAKSRYICTKLGAVPTKDIFTVTYPDGGSVLKPHTLIWPLSKEKFNLVINSEQPINLGYGSW